MKFFEGIPYSDYIDIEAPAANDVQIHISKPTENMQTDSADFEALALMCKCVKPISNVSIRFNIHKWDGTFGQKQDNGKTCAYLRFLYRLLMFKEAFPSWVLITDDACNKEVARFSHILNTAIENGLLSNNIPTGEAGYSRAKGAEHIIENKLSRTAEGTGYLKELYRAKMNVELDFVFSQLPNGLFNIANNQKPEEKNRVFTTGFYDIWGVNEKGDFCVFELKKDKGNAHLGVITELFFYAVYAKNILCDKLRLHEKDGNVNYRGYDKLFDAVHSDKIKGVNALFLFGNDVYKVIRENESGLIALMNTNTFDIRFDVLNYEISRIDAISDREL